MPDEPRPLLRQELSGMVNDAAVEIVLYRTYGRLGEAVAASDHDRNMGGNGRLRVIKYRAFSRVPAHNSDDADS